MAQMPKKDQLTGNVTAGEFKTGLNQLYEVVDVLNKIDPAVLINEKVSASEKKTNEAIEKAKVTKVSQLENDKKFLVAADLSNKTTIEDSAVPQVVKEAISNVAKKEDIPKNLSQLLDDKKQLGIVAGSLTENGWVRFANGLILQWGKHLPTSSNWWKYKVTFPVQFSSSVLGIVVQRIEDYNESSINATLIRRYDSSGFTLNNSTYSEFWYVAIGR